MRACYRQGILSVSPVLYIVNDGLDHNQSKWMMLRQSYKSVVHYHILSRTNQELVIFEVNPVSFIIKNEF